ncbi:ATP-binding protein [Oscillochloris sp. ZM17-4]|uniref:AAA family ATPase n=1 Tax=Oscillochloris sp. ZM17-4 TaxID=2866714 RepID=UPI001C72EBCA|nr:AAA family ATPase [Oscillochloris sp. ZM17-4]MBX0328195.1 ATP-binding protein [Oscillochloris sp. ZM17-4]
MLGLRGFIPHKNQVDKTTPDAAYPDTNAILSALNAGTSFDLLLVMTLLGKAGTGKSFLLKYFATEYRQQVCGIDIHRAPVLYADYDETEKNTLGADTTAPITATMLSSIMFSLAQLARQVGGNGALPRWYREEQSLYSSRQLLWLFGEICLELKRLDVRTLIIDNAHRLDAKTVKLLFRMRARLNNQIGLIFGAQLQLSEGQDEPMGRLFKQARIDESGVEQPIELRPLVSKEFYEAVITPVFKDIGASFEPELIQHFQVIIRQFWKVTAGDWKSIDTRTRHFNRLLGPRSREDRLITRSMVEQVLNFKLPN